VRVLAKVPGDAVSVLLAWPVVYWLGRSPGLEVDLAIPANAAGLRRLFSRQAAVNRVIVSDTACGRALWAVTPTDLEVDPAWGPWDKVGVIHAPLQQDELLTVSLKRSISLQMPNSLLLLQPTLFLGDIKKENRLTVLPGRSSRYQCLVETVIKKSASLFDSVYLLGTRDELGSWRGVRLPEKEVRDWYEGACELAASRFFLGCETTGAYVANLLKVSGVCAHTYSHRISSLPWYITGEGLFSAELRDMSAVDELAADILDYLREAKDASEAGCQHSEASGEAQSEVCADGA